MAGLKSIKGKIRGIDKTHKVTKAMEAVSAVKMRKSQERALQGRPYAAAALSILGRLGGSLDLSRHPFLLDRGGRRLCVLVVTSDKGLAGSLNSSVFKAVEERILRGNIKKEDVGILALGRKGHDYFAKRGYTIIKQFASLNDDVISLELAPVLETLTSLFLEKTYDRFDIAYSQFRSTFEQRATVRQVLPLFPEDIAQTIEEIIPEKGKYSELKQEEAREIYTVEPDHETVLNILIPFLLQIEVFHGLLEGKASEHSARMVAMKNASDKAHDLSKELNRVYNKARQAQITREVSEIIGGIDALKT